MALQDFRPRDRVIQAVFWDGSAAAEEDVRLLVGLAGGRVAFDPGNGVRGLTMWLVGGKRAFSAARVGGCWLLRDGVVVTPMRPGTFGKVFAPVVALDPGPLPVPLVVLTPLPLAPLRPEAPRDTHHALMRHAAMAADVKPSDTRET